MSKTAKNLIIVLGIVTVVFAGYYFFIQEASLVMRSTESDQQLKQMLVRTQEFVEHRRILDEVDLQIEILQSDEFKSLQSFSPEPDEFLVGRENPFTTAAPERPINLSVTKPVVATQSPNVPNQE